MRFFLDENFPFSAKEFLETLGNEVLCSLDFHPQGTDDNTLFHHAQDEKAVLLTTDKDFYHTIPFLYETRSAAVVVIALNQPNRDKILSRLNSLLESVDLDSNRQGVYLITDNKIYLRN